MYDIRKYEEECMKKKKQPSITKKMIAVTSIYFAIFIVFVAIVLQYFFTSKARDDLLGRQQYESGLIVQQMNNLLNNVKNCSDNIVLSLNTALDLNDENVYEHRETIRTILENNLFLFSEVEEAEILLNSGERYWKIRKSYFHYENSRDDLYNYYKSLSCGISGKWYRCEDEKDRFCYIRELSKADTAKRVGYILLFVNEETLYNYYKNEKNSQGTDIYIYNQNDCLISASDREITKDAYVNLDGYTYEELIAPYKHSKNYHLMENMLEYDWKFCSVRDIRESMRGFKTLTMGVLWSSLFFMVVFSMIFIVILNRIMIPIRTLSWHMLTEGIDTETKIKEPQTNDEVGVLITNYNVMIDRNKELISRIKAEEDMKRRLELALLQAQIKPHFLYNTLDTAFCLSKMKRNKEASYVIKELAGYYRMVLSHGNEWINLKEEINAAESYLKIQAVRFGEIITYDILIDEDLYSFRVPKMILQPLIENAIYHGIKPTGRKGKISIKGEIHDHTIYIIVIDDGIGFARKKFNEIINNEQIEEEYQSFGVRSTMERLKLYYGNTAELTLGEVTVGTSMVIRIQLDEKVQNDEI